MSMEKTDALFLLVKSLTKSEKRQFKLYAEGWVVILKRTS